MTPTVDRDGSVEPPLGNPVCITGMHGSGASLVVGVLRDAGLYLGPEDQLAGTPTESANGLFENSRITDLNESLLASLGGSWDDPVTLPDGWEADETKHPLRQRAQTLVYQLAARREWGWKDPRTCLVLPFWRKVLPNLRTIVCLRNPLDVAASLHRRNGFSASYAVRLWYRYNSAVIEAGGQDNVAVTHYDTWFSDPERELGRLAAFAGLALSPDRLRTAIDRVRPEGNRSSASFADLVAAGVSSEVLGLYRKLAVLAGHAEAESWTIPETVQSGSWIDREAMEAQRLLRDAACRRQSDSPAGVEGPRDRRLRREIDQLTNALVYLEGRVDELKRAVEHARAQRDWHSSDRDHLASLLESRAEELQSAEANVTALRHQLEETQLRARRIEESLAAVDNSRLVRLQRRYWRLLSGFRRK